jgi:hypothetical protein
MRNQNSPLTRSDCTNVGIRKAKQPSGLGCLKINRRLAPKQSGNDLRVKVLVGLEPRLRQLRTGAARLAACNFS